MMAAIASILLDWLTVVEAEAVQAVGVRITRLLR